MAGFSWTDDDGGPGDHAGSSVEPYAGSDASGQQTGSQDLGNANPTPHDNLAPYGTQDGGTYDSSPDDATPAGPRNFQEEWEHRRASTVTGTHRPYFETKGKKAFDTVPGVDGADQWEGPDPVDRKGSGTTQRP